MAYLDKISTLYKSGNATEHSYRPALQDYLESLLPGYTATNEPKRQKCGAPDYIITRHTRGNAIPVGFIEAKDVGKNLDEIEKGEQFTRYKESLDNLILTDYLDFRFYKEGKKVAQVRIAHSLMHQIQPIPENIGQLETLLKDFAAFQGQTIKSAQDLAVLMARKAKLMQDVFRKAVSVDEHTALKDQLAAFRQILIHDMDADGFADVYAQTITYGLFTARLHDNTPSDFSRKEALDLIPMSNPFLRKLFQYVAVELEEGVAWIVDALCELLRAADIHDIMADFGKQSGRNDPIVHFYETFLAEYNPKLRKSRGVWYTPEPVVNFIIRAVDDCLKTHFNLPMGLADTSKVKIKVDTQAFDKRTKSGKALVDKEVHKVQLLDVATGTGTFIAEVIKQIYNGHFQHQQGMWSDYVEEHLLPRLHGFEILMASYAMCHMKIELLLNETGYKPKNVNKPPRLGVYLTNSLEEAHPDAQTLFASWLSAEANEANLVKRETPVMVAFGNPPYSGVSSNTGDWITAKIEDYKYVNGEHFGERKHWLQDDYVKFIRLGEHFVERNGEGILAYITNHGYIDNPTFRGMRWHLLNTFDDIYVLDLHGNAKKKEESPDGAIDKNVFDIQQGVAIFIGIKHGENKQKLAQVHHADLWGSREEKYSTLWDNSLSSIKFNKITYTAPYYFFCPKNESSRKQYEKGFQLQKMFPTYVAGVVTARDELVIDIDKSSLVNRMQFFCDDEKSDEEVRQHFFGGKKDGKYPPGDSRGWKLPQARKSIKDNVHKDILRTISYRPFDTRWIYYDAKMVDWGRQEMMRHFDGEENIGLCLSKRKETGGDWDLVFVSKNMIQHHTLSIKEVNYQFPLYLYNGGNTQLTLGGGEHCTPNMDEKIAQQIAKKLGLQFVTYHKNKKIDGKTAFSPLDVLDYVYAVLHSPTYRETYKEFLKIDFPCIPYPDDAKTFWQLVALGREIRLLHLLEGPALGKFITKYPVGGDNLVDKPEYKGGKVYINKDQFFEGVPQIAWDFYIGGYQPAQKWLKDRKGRTLNFEDITHYQKIIIALAETDRLMKEIDATWKP